ncbi:hypothetical protein SESBI_37435 [Sesbania bispinosa]|nr:hypothetical protein SESBI_37435 [Sesbania bispinosa]
MLGTGLHFRRGRGEDRFYNPVQARQSMHSSENDKLRRAHSDVMSSRSVGEKTVDSGRREPENRTGSDEQKKPVAVPSCEPVVKRLSNLERFLQAITPSVPAQHLPKRTMRGCHMRDVEFQSYFVLGDLWESFREWSAYGAGVPLVLNGNESVVQYYVPYLSGIQIYGTTAKPSLQSRMLLENCRWRSRAVVAGSLLGWIGSGLWLLQRENQWDSYCEVMLQHCIVLRFVYNSNILFDRQLGEDSDSDFRDSSSDGSSDCEPERGFKCLGEHRNLLHLSDEVPHCMGRLSLRDHPTVPQDGFSSDDGEPVNSQGNLLFEYLEQDPPYSREPLADKILDLAFRFPDLATLRSCDILPSSWISIAWYPIYRIPTGPTLKDLDACFLTYHSLYTPVGGLQRVQAPGVSYLSEMDGVHKMSLPVFGLASYKFKGSVWTPNGGYERQLATSLVQDAESWLRLLQVNHPDFLFFSRR